MENPAVPGCLGCLMLLLLVRTVFRASGGGAGTSGGNASPFSPCGNAPADICKSGRNPSFFRAARVSRARRLI